RGVSRLDGRGALRKLPLRRRADQTKDVVQCTAAVCMCCVISVCIRTGVAAEVAVGTSVDTRPIVARASIHHPRRRSTHSIPGTVPDELTRNPLASGREPGSRVMVPCMETNARVPSLESESRRYVARSTAATPLPDAPTNGSIVTRCQLCDTLTGLSGSVAGIP